MDGRIKSVCCTPRGAQCESILINNLGTVSSGLLLSAVEKGRGCQRECAASLGFGAAGTGGGPGRTLVFKHHLRAHAEASLQIHLLAWFIRSGASFTDIGALWPFETEALTTELCPMRTPRMGAQISLWLQRN